MVEADFPGEPPQFLKEVQKVIDSGFETWGMVWYVWGQDGEVRIHCEEGSCTFHLEGSCRNPEPVIEDDCFMSSSCASYEPKIIDPQDIQIIDRYWRLSE